MKNPVQRFLIALFSGLCVLLAGQGAWAQNPAVARTSPPWLRDAVVYEVFPRAFSPGGDLKGVTARLDELQRLGVTVLWTMPIHPIGEKLRKGAFGSPYSIRDFFAVDPNYGTMDDLKTLVAGAHQRGMKVILDLVANHTSWDSVMMQHPDFYKQDAQGHIIPPVPEWTDVAGLNYTNAALRQYMIGMLKYWIREAGVDGFRCDTASMVPTDFWEQVRDELGKIKPDLLMLAEASKPELLVKAFDIDYAWPLMGALGEVLTQGAPASRLRQSWEQSRREFPQGSLHLRMSDNHDEARAVARFGIQGALAASALMFSLDGVPLLYNGMEVGDATDSGDPALFEKVPLYWSPKNRPPLRAIYHGLIKLRKEFPAFRTDQVIWLTNSADADVVSVMRADDHDEFVTVVNFSNRPLASKVEVKNSGDFKPVRISGLPEPAADDFPGCHLKGFEWRVYHRVNSPNLAEKNATSGS